MMDNQVTGSKNICKCPHHMVGPLVVVLFGLLFLLGAYDVFSPRFVEVAWPILVIAGGLFKWGERKCTCC